MTRSGHVSAFPSLECSLSLQKVFQLKVDLILKTPIQWRTYIFGVLKLERLRSPLQTSNIVWGTPVIFLLGADPQQTTAILLFFFLFVVVENLSWRTAKVSKSWLAYICVDGRPLHLKKWVIVHTTLF